jgi:hypothetical protein
MQIIPRYLVKQRVNIVADVAGFVTEYRPVYRKQVQVYKGIDNVIEFRLLNTDQKPINAELYTLKFVAFDENKNLIIAHDGVSIQEGDSTGYTYKGVYTVTITENDLLNVKQQYLTYNIYLVDSNNDKIITYTDSHFGNDGVIRISAEAFPGPQETYSISQFTQISENTEYVSESVDAQPGINGNEALHTAAVYTNGYAGDITVQATLDNQVTGTTSWADLTTVTFTGSETTPTPINFNGVFTYLRFKTDANPSSTITKILVRN